MLSKSNPLCLTAILALALPVLGFSTVIVTGVEAGAGGTTVCGTGGTTCSTGLATGPLTSGTSTTGSYNFDVTATSGDVYDVSGTFKNSLNPGVFLGFFPTVTLISGAATGADTVTLNMLQDFFSATLTNWSGTYNEKIPFDLSVAGTTAEGQVFYSTNVDTTPQSVGLLGPVDGPGSFYLTTSKSLTLTGSSLISDYQLTFTFPDGAPKGSSISSVPEPSQTIPLGIGLAGLLLFNLRKLLPSGGSRLSQ